MLKRNLSKSFSYQITWDPFFKKSTGAPKECNTVIPQYLQWLVLEPSEIPKSTDAQVPYTEWTFCCCLVAKSSPTLLRPHGLQPTRFLCLWDYPGKNIRVGGHFLLQGIFLTQGLNPRLLHWQADSSLLSHLGSPAPNPSHIKNYTHALAPDQSLSAQENKSPIQESQMLFAWSEIQRSRYTIHGPELRNCIKNHGKKLPENIFGFKKRINV